MYNRNSQTFDYQRAYSYTVKLLTGRDYSEKKIREKLLQKKCSKTIIDQILEEIKERGFLREERYVEARIKAFMNKGYSKRYILQKISQEAEQINADIIDTIFLEYRTTEEEQITKLVQKRIPKVLPIDFEEKKKIFQKVLRFVVSKGHNPSGAFRFIKLAMGKDGLAALEEINLEIS